MIVPGHALRAGERFAQAVTRRILRVGSRWVLAGRVRVHIEGGHHLPPRGPALIAARHYHHLYDGCVLLGMTPRPAHILVALDWVRGRPLRRVMEGLCAAAQWPVVLRAENLAAHDGGSAYRADEVSRYLRRAVRDAVALLRAGRALASACTGGCAQTWPPLLAAGSSAPTSADTLSGKLTVQTTGNGSQVEYNGHLLYTYAGDSAPGATMGQGLFGKWFVATPDLK